MIVEKIEAAIKRAKSVRRSLTGTSMRQSEADALILAFEVERLRKKIKEEEFKGMDWGVVIKELEKLVIKLKSEITELNEALKGRTVSCICGGK